MLSLTGQTINVMTLGGLALAVGILVDDATVEIENTHRNMAMKKPLVRAVLDGAQQIAAPAFVSTLCICVVFVPVLLLTGAARFLFTPLAMAVVYAMMASYLLSRTLIPNMVHYMLRPEMKLYILGEHGETAGGKGLIWWMHYAFNRQFERLRDFYISLLDMALEHRKTVLVRVPAVCPRLAGADSLHRQRLLPDCRFGTAAPARANARGHATGTGGSGIRPDRRRNPPRDPAERTGHDHRQYRPAERRLQPGFRRQSDAGHGRRRNPVLAQREADGLHGGISGPAAQAFERRVPGSEFLFRSRQHHQPDSEFRTSLARSMCRLRAGIRRPAMRSRSKLREQIARIPGAVDVHVHQVVDYPEIRVNVDRNKAGQIGLSQSDVANSLLISLSGTRPDRAGANG